MKCLWFTRQVKVFPMYVKKAIENLLQHKDIKRSSHHELKVACEEALKAIDASNNNSTADSGEINSNTTLICICWACTVIFYSFN